MRRRAAQPSLPTVYHHTACIPMNWREKCTEWERVVWEMARCFPPYDANRCRRLFWGCFHMPLTVDSIFKLQSQEIKQTGSPLTEVVVWLIEHCSGCRSLWTHKTYSIFLPKIREQVLTPVSWLKLNHVLFLFLLLCHSSPLTLLLPLLFSPYFCPSPFFRLPPSLPFAWSQTTAQIYRRWRDASRGQMHERLPVCLPCHSLWLIQWWSLHYPELYAAIITSPPGPCRTALALSSYHLTQEERNAGNSRYIAQHLPPAWLHCESLNFTSSHPQYVMYVVYDWDHRLIL